MNEVSLQSRGDATNNAVSCAWLPTSVVTDYKSCSLILVLRAESEPSSVVCLALSSPPVLNLVSAEVRATLHDLDVPHIVKDATPISSGKERNLHDRPIQQAARSY
jgi:hypothetical protein